MQCILESLTLWDYTPCAIKLAPYYKQLLQWCDSVDVIRSPPYTGPPVRYPDREHDQLSQAVVDGELEHDALNTDIYPVPQVKSKKPTMPLAYQTKQVAYLNLNYQK